MSHGAGAKFDSNGPLLLIGGADANAWKYCVLYASVQIDDPFDPADVIGHFGVDAVFAALATALAETGDAEDGPPVADGTEQGTTGVTGARIDTTLAVAGAEHILRNEVVLVYFTARGCLHDGNLQM